MTEFRSYTSGFATVGHDTFYIDYIGRLRQTGYANKIRDVRFLCKPAAGNTLHLNVIDHGGQPTSPGVWLLLAERGWSGDGGSAWADDGAQYPLWLGGTQVTGNSLAGEGWAYDPASQTLTLDGYNFVGAGHEEVCNVEDDTEYRHAPIFWTDKDGTLTIQLVGENSVSVPKGDLDATTDTDEDDADSPINYYHGVYSAGGLAIKGTGGLLAEAATSEYGAVGIFAVGDLSIEGGSITARGSENGLETYDGVVRMSAGTVVAEAIEEGDGDSFAGICADGVKVDGGTLVTTGYYGIYTGGYVTVNGGEVTARSTITAADYEGSILAPSGIYCDGGTVTVNGGTLRAEGPQYGIYCYFHVPSSGDDDEDGEEVSAEQEEAQEKDTDDVVVTGGALIAEATINKVDATAIRAHGSAVTVTGGSVQAIASGDESFGIDAHKAVTIEGGVSSFVAAGTAGALKKDSVIKNAIAGLGYTNVDGTAGKAIIAANASGQVVNGYKRVLFPAVAAAATTPPVGRTLTYNGQPQELVTAGVANGGEMRYSLDGSSFDTKLPTATEAGRYTVYYQVVGDESHTDSEVKTVEAVIVGSSAYSTTSGDGTAAASSSVAASSGTSKTTKSLPKTGETDAPFTIAIALAGVALLLTARRIRLWPSKTRG